MPKLTGEKAERVSNASDGGFDLIEDGTYHFRLRDVDVREGPKGPYWVWEYEGVDADVKGRRQWNNTSLSESSDWAFKQTFAAFGVPADTDTDDLLGEVVRLQIGHRTIQQGARKGELANQVARVMPKDDEFEDPRSALDDDDIFN